MARQALQQAIILLLHTVQLVEVAPAAAAHDDGGGGVGRAQGQQEAGPRAGVRDGRATICAASLCAVDGWTLLTFWRLALERRLACSKQGMPQCRRQVGQWDMRMQQQGAILSLCSAVTQQSHACAPLQRESRTPGPLVM